MPAAQAHSGEPDGPHDAGDALVVHRPAVVAEFGGDLRDAVGAVRVLVH
jgi:hypothetical protein